MHPVNDFIEKSECERKGRVAEFEISIWMFTFAIILGYFLLATLNVLSLFFRNEDEAKYLRPVVLQRDKWRWRAEWRELLCLPSPAFTPPIRLSRVFSSHLILTLSSARVSAKEYCGL